MSQIVFMKKAFKSLLFVVIMLSILLVLPGTATAKNQKDSIYTYLTKDLGFSKAAACGIMANIEKESNFDPTLVARDSNGLLSGGLCMWNGSRFASLKKYCNSKGYNYLSVKGQLNYLTYELKQDYYKHIYNYLKSVPNTAQGAYNAAHYWCYYFEVPQNRKTSAVTRGNIAKNTYWAKYSSNELNSFTLSFPNDKGTADLASSAKLSWSNAGKAAKSYTVYVAKHKDGKADFENAKKIKLSADTLSYKLKLSELGKGKFSVYILAKSSSKSLKSNTVTFTAKCLEHIYTSKITKKVTENADGTRTYTCKNCGETIKKTISSKPQDITPSIKAYGVTEIQKTSVTFKLSFPKGTDGYECYRYNGEKWVKVNVLPSDKKTVTIGGLSAGKDYKFRFRAFKDKAEKTEYSPYKTITVPTEPEKVTINSVSRPGKGAAGLGWKAVSGADGYEVFMATSADGKYKRVKTLGSKKLSTEIKELKSSKKYFFKVRAINKSGSLTSYSDFSSIKYVVAK